MTIMNRLKDIFGQDLVIANLRGAIEAGRLAHGLIFAGPEGVGKATCAAALGAFFLCEQPEPDDACGKCPSCRAISAGTHPDYHVISKELARLYDKSGTSKATLLPINVIRHALAEPAGRKTVLGRGKVFIVEQAELMTPAAQNALLKTLEEPAGRTLIVLLTMHGNELLPTIRSRCQTFPFAALKTELVARELKRRGIEAATAQTAAELADGSLGVALRWVEDDILNSAAIIAESVDSALAGKANDLGDLLRKRADAYAQKVLARDELASKDSAVRNGLAMYLGIAARRIRGRLVEAELSERACFAIEAIVRAEKYLDANVNVSIVLEQLSGAI
jgi:DNA polymerase III subunit delta'